MKHILTSVFLVVLLFPALALGGEVKLEDLVYREGLYYKKFSDSPFTGICNCGGVNGASTMQGSFKDGKAEGPWVEFYGNGQLFGKFTYKDGVKVGPYVTYHKNGQLEFKGTYKDGYRDGPWFRYHDNGQLMSKGTYKDGEKVN